jgi:hypothetical protein
MLQGTNDLAKLGVLALLLLVLPKTTLAESLAYAAILIVGELRVHAVVKLKDALHKVEGSRLNGLRGDAIGGRSTSGTYWSIASAPYVTPLAANVSARVRV